MISLKKNIPGYILLLSAAICFILLLLNWNNWSTAALIQDDIYREFFTPLRILHEEVMYKDFNFLYGPIPQYLNAFIVFISPLKLFNTLRIVAFILYLLKLFFIYLICKKLNKTFFFPIILFVSVCIIDYRTFNPTSFNYLYSILFGTVSIWASIAIVTEKARNKKNLFWLVLGVCCAICLLSKPEGLFASGFAVLIAIYFEFQNSNKLKYILYDIIYLISGAIIILIPVLLYFNYKNLSVANLIEGIIQKRFQYNLSFAPLAQYAYFHGSNGFLVIIAWICFLMTILILIRFLNIKKTKQLLITLTFFILILLFLLLLRSNLIIRLLDKLILTGCFFGGIIGYFWIKSIGDKNDQKALLVYWFSSFGVWIRPFIHTGAIILPYKVGGGVLLALLFWIYMVPFIYENFFKQYLLIKTKRIYIFMVYFMFITYGLTAFTFNLGKLFPYSPITFNTPYGKFSSPKKTNEIKEQLKAVSWLKHNLKEGKRAIFLGAFPMELLTGELQCIPFSQVLIQVYPGDVARFEKIVRNKKIKYIVVELMNCAYSFGFQDYKLADYLENNWNPVQYFNVPESLEGLNLNSISWERKIDAGLTVGFIIYKRRNKS